LRQYYTANQAKFVTGGGLKDVMMMTSQVTVSWIVTW